MKLTAIKSLFSNGDPYVQIVQPFVLDDFYIDIVKPEAKPDKAISSTFHRDIGAIIYFYPKDDVIDRLKEHFESIGRIFKYNDYYYGSDNKDRHYNYIDTRQRNLKFTGIRTPEGKKRKYMKSYNDFMEEFDSNTEKLTQELLDRLNKELKSQVKISNESYNRSHMELFTTTQYEKSWQSYFDEEKEKFDELGDKKSVLQKQIDELNSKVNELKREEKKLKIEIVRKELDSSKMPENIKKEIKDKLDSGDAWKTRSRGIRFS